MQTPYTERTWLNGPTSPSTGSVVAYDGELIDAKTNEFSHSTFLEIADCHGKVCLHQARYDTPADFLHKLRILHGVVGRFIEHMEKR